MPPNKEKQTDSNDRIEKFFKRLKAVTEFLRSFIQLFVTLF